MADRISEAPLRRVFAVEDIPPEGVDVTVEASHEEREALARALGVPAINHLIARFSVKGTPQRLDVLGAVEASLRQVCVVSLDTFDNEVREDVAVTFAEPGAVAVPADGHPDLHGFGREPPDEIVEGSIDLGALTAQFLALGLDPYPRKPGASFAYKNDDDAGPSPFAALARLKLDSPKER